MIKAIFYKTGVDYNEYEITGHSNYAENGKDIVCATTSVLTIHTTELLMTDLQIIKNIKQKDGYMKVELTHTNSLANLLIAALKRTLLEISNKYPDYLSIEVKENAE